MRWFTFGGDGAMLPWKEWRMVVADPEDLLACVTLGGKAYRACMKEAGLPVEKGAKGALTAFAHILHHMMDEMDVDRWMELRFYLQESWKEEEPGLWDPPDQVIWPAGNDMRRELPALRHGLERAVGPDLMRLFWASVTSTGRRTPLLSVEARNGLFFPLVMLDKLRAENIPPFLDEEEREGMAFLREELRLSDRLSTDELAAELSSQGQMVRGDKVFMEGPVSGGRWYDDEDVRRWREKGLRCCALLCAFRVMFLASVSGESGPLRVSFPGASPD